jgi:hypothetical protein
MSESYEKDETCTERCALHWDNEFGDAPCDGAQSCGRLMIKRAFELKPIVTLKSDYSGGAL